MIDIFHFHLRTFYSLNDRTGSLIDDEKQVLVAEKLVMIPFVVYSQYKKIQDMEALSNCSALSNLFRPRWYATVNV